MGSNVRHDSDDMRGRADLKYSVAPGFRERGVDDHDWDADFNVRGGTGVYPNAQVFRVLREARTKGYNTVADGYDGSGDVGYRGANDFDHADVQGGRGVEGQEL